jgi:hypothetical protein
MISLTALSFPTAIVTDPSSLFPKQAAEAQLGRRCARALGWRGNFVGSGKLVCAAASRDELEVVLIIFFTEERLLSVVSPLGDMAGLTHHFSLGFLGFSWKIQDIHMILRE